MTLNDFGRFLNTKSIGRIEAPVNEQLTERVFTAMKHIAMGTLCLKWVIHENFSDYKIFRMIDANTAVRYPNKPIVDSSAQLDIDESLLDALALYVMAGLEMQRSKILMGMYYEEIEKNNQRLVETYLQEATNDSERFHVFP